MYIDIIFGDIKSAPAPTREVARGRRISTRPQAGSRPASRPHPAARGPTPPRADGVGPGPEADAQRAADPAQARIPDQATAAGGYGVWGLEDAEAGQDPDSSCPPEYVGLSHREIFAAADAWEAGHPQAAEIIDAGFLPRDVPATVRSAGAAGGFASGGPLDGAPPELAVAHFAEEVTGPDGRCAGASDDELIGVLGSWQRQESRAAARKLAVIAELIRRRPAPGCAPAVPGGMPRAWGKFCADELAAATACSGQAAEKTLSLAHDLATRLPGTARRLV